MFNDVVQYTQLFKSDWPAVTIGDKPSYLGNRGNRWNYGAMDRNDFAGGDLKEHATEHSGGVGMFGTMGVKDENSRWKSGKFCLGEFKPGLTCSG